MTASAPEPNPDREIDLVWSQKLAAWWAISWPAGCCALLPANFLVPRDYSIPAQSWRSGLRLHEAFLVVQLLFVRRIVWKNYGTFRVFAVRSEGPPERNLSMRESCQVWLRLIALQVAFLALFRMAAALMPAQSSQTLGSLSLWLRILVVGPVSVGLAMRTTYPGFRLQAVGRHTGPLRGSNSVPAS